MQYGTGGGKVSLGESMWGGLANAVSGHAYGYKLVKSAGQEMLSVEESRDRGTVVSPQNHGQ